jgi:hypothetical protein
MLTIRLNAISKVLVLQRLLPHKSIRKSPNGMPASPEFIAFPLSAIKRNAPQRQLVTIDTVRDTLHNIGLCLRYPG